MEQKYLELLKNNIMLEVLPPIKTSNDHHDIKCLQCGEVFNATPKAKVQRFRQHGTLGCPSCTLKEKYLKETLENIKQIKDLGFDILTKYVSTKDEISVRNMNCCGRIFKTIPNNILSGRSICRPCNDARKRAAFQKINQERHLEALQYKHGFDRYTKQVRVLTEQTYCKYRGGINPKDFPRHRSGTKGYHLDHIVSIYICFHAEVPPEVCAHPDNLQMLEWYENAAKANKPPEVIPTILESFLH